MIRALEALQNGENDTQIRAIEKELADMSCITQAYRDELMVTYRNIIRNF